jgi:hypothetical protein
MSLIFSKWPDGKVDVQRLTLGLTQQRMELHPIFQLDPSRRIDVDILQRLSGLAISRAWYIWGYELLTES